MTVTSAPFKVLRAAAAHDQAARVHGHPPLCVLGESEKDAKSAQKLGQLQPFIAVFLQAWANMHLLGQPNTSLAHDARSSDRKSRSLP